MRIDVVAAVIYKSDEVLITQRRKDAHLAGLWEFPGGKVEAGESLQTALKREIREEIGIEIQVTDEFLTIDHDYPGKSVRLHFFKCTVLKGDAQPLDVADLKWVTVQDLTNYRFPPADAELLVKLRSTSKSLA